MHWAMTHDPGEQPATPPAWIAKNRLPADLRNRATGNADTSDTSGVSGSGSQLWEDNFRALHAEMLKVAHRYPGLMKEINSTLEHMEKPEPWN